MLETSSLVNGLMAGSRGAGACVAAGDGARGVDGEVVWATAVVLRMAIAAAAAIGRVRMARLRCRFRLHCEQAAADPGSPIRSQRRDAAVRCGAPPACLALRY